jgi:transcriptional regulator with XRE-family HTH domain
MNWGWIVRQVRGARGLKQAAFADLLGVSQTTVSRWETSLQVPELQFQQRLQRDLQEIDPVAVDDIALLTVRNSLSPRSLSNGDGRVALASRGLEKRIGPNVERLLGSRLQDVVTERTNQVIEEYLPMMLRPGSDIISIRYTDDGYFVRGRHFTKTWSVIKLDGVRFVTCEDIEIPGPATESLDIEVFTIGEARAIAAAMHG